MINSLIAELLEEAFPDDYHGAIKNEDALDIATTKSIMDLLDAYISDTLSSIIESADDATRYLNLITTHFNIDTHIASLFEETITCIVENKLHNNIDISVAVPYAVPTDLLSDNIIIKAYAFGYPVTFNGKLKQPSAVYFTQAVKNGLHVTHILDGKFLRDIDIAGCNAIEVLHCDNNACITTCDHFAATLRVIHACGTCGISDDGLRLCVNVRELYCDNNPRITTCVPFPNLEILRACGKSGITDATLVTTTHIKVLFCSQNPNITTCDPFASKLQVLSCADNSGITDKGLVQCKTIEKLYCDNNPNITTCKPFAHSLTLLNAYGNCGISDGAITECPKLTKLYGGKNPRITIKIPAQ